MGSHVMCKGAIHYSTQPPETPVLWPPHEKSWLIGKDSDAWREWVQEELGAIEDEMAGWHHWLDGHLSELRELVMDREAWHAVIHGVAKSRTRLSDWSDLIWSDPASINVLFVLVIKKSYFIKTMNLWCRHLWFWFYNMKPESQRLSIRTRNSLNHKPVRLSFLSLSFVGYP